MNNAERFIVQSKEKTFALPKLHLSRFARKNFGIPVLIIVGLNLGGCAAVSAIDAITPDIDTIGGLVIDGVDMVTPDILDDEDDD